MDHHLIDLNPSDPGLLSFFIFLRDVNISEYLIFPSSCSASSPVTLLKLKLERFSMIFSSINLGDVDYRFFLK